MNYMFLAKKLSDSMLEIHTDDKITLSDLQQLMCLDACREPVSMSDYTDDDWMYGESLSDRLDDSLEDYITTIKVLTLEEYADVRELYAGLVNDLRAAEIDRALFTKRLIDICEPSLRESNSKMMDYAINACINEMTGQGRGETRYYGF